MEQQHLWLKRRLGILLAALLLVSSLGWLGAFHWSLDLLAHFRIHYLIGCAMLLIISLGFRFRTEAIAAAGLLTFCAATTLLPLYTGADKAPTTGPRLTCLHANVLSSNPQRQPLLDLIASETPDIILLEEVTQAVLDDLGPSLTNYLHQILAPRENNFGIALYSRHPIRSRSTATWLGHKFPQIVATLDTPLGPIQLLGLHPTPPIGKNGTTIRRLTLEHAVATLQPGLPAILMGDLNATPWSADFRYLVRASGLTDSQRGQGYQPTWPARLGLLGIPIDHCLHSPELISLERRIGPDIGSDHRPLIVVLGKHDKNV